MNNLSQNEWASQIKNDANCVILDVRTDEEVEEGVIYANAVHADIYKGQGFIDQIEALDKTKNYYVYCRSGARSSQACGVMNQLGFENTNNLEGGILEWEGELVNLN